MNTPLFEIDDWKVIRRGLPDNMRLMESITSLGNGYMGQRGNFEEGYSGDSHRGTYLAGVWFPDKTRVGWWKNGYPQYFGKMLNAIDFLRLDITINGQKVNLAAAEHSDFYVELDMSCGLLTRSYILDISGTKLRLVFRRFLSITQRQLAHIQVQFSVLVGRAEVQVSSMLDGDVHNEDSNFGETFWDVQDKSPGEYAFLQMQTKENPFGTPRFVIGAAMANRLWGIEPSQVTFKSNEYIVRACYRFCLGQGQTCTLEKTVALVTNRDVAANQHRQTAEYLLKQALTQDFDTHLQIQKDAWAKRWEKADVTIEGCPEAQQGIRFNIFHLFCTYYGEDDRLNVGPKGFTGEKYGGATYWDTEAYILPMYLSVAEPEVSEMLLQYRYNQLDGARHNARQQGLAGALYPMVTFAGVECHNEWEITFEEIHRNGAIAYAIYNYTNYTGDDRFLLSHGIEVLVEIARFWADRVHFSVRHQQYMIHGVTGPNEYENNVNNNWYTNTLAKWVLEYTLETLDRVPREKQQALAVTTTEREHWYDISQNMYLPFDEKLGVFVQHDTFLDKDLKTTDTLALDERPLNQHWSWDRILRSCFIKQADVLQGIYLFGNRYTLEEKQKNFDFYEPMTVHESSLSACIHSILAAELGMEKKAVELYARTARLDLDNYNRDTEDGLHITSMSGSWLAIVHGFAGMRTWRGVLSFAPFCPKGWNGYSFEINYRGRRIHFRVDYEEVKMTLREGAEMEIELYGRPYVLMPEMTSLVPVNTLHSERGKA